MRVRGGECCERVHAELGGYVDPGSACGGANPQCHCPGVCVVKSASKCVLKRAHSVGVMASASKKACVGERACVRGTACVRSRYEREMAVGMRENATTSPSESVMARCVSVVARGSACVEWRRRRRQTRDKGHVAAVAVSRTVPDSHSSAHEVRAVLRMRPPRLRK